MPPTRFLSSSSRIPSCSIRTFPTRPLDRRRPISTYGYTQAKALVYAKHGEPKDVLSLHTHSLPPPHSTLLTLRTLAAPLNPADINQIQGTYPARPAFTTTLGTPTPTAVPGNEACFEVLACGSAVTTVHRGDWVLARHTGLGTWRTHLQVDEGQVLRVEKDGLRAEQVGTVGVNPVTAWRLLTDFVALRGDGEGEGVGKGGDWYVQNGANSGVGRAALQLGRRWGYRCIAVVRDRPGAEGEALKQELRDLGATKVVAESEVLARDFAARVRDWTQDGGGGGVKLGLNCVGGKAATAMARVLAPGAHMVTYGAMSRRPMEMPAGLLIFQDVRFAGFWVSRWGDGHPGEKARTVGALLGMMRAGTLRDAPVVAVPWGWETGAEELVGAVQGTLEGYRRGKGVFVFGEM